MDCVKVEEKLALFLYEELGPEEHAAVEAHLGGCARCAAAAAALRRLHAALDARPQPVASPDLLVRCRWDLDEALDRESHGWRGLLGSWWGLSPAPAAWRLTSLLAVLVVGFSLGWTLQQRRGLPVPGATPQATPWIGADLADYQINGISQVAPNPQTGAVRITLDAERQVTLEGSLEDSRIRHVLVEAMKGYDNAGIRRDTLEVLRTRADNPYVREALLHAVRWDPNPGMRLEALEAARGMHCTADLHGALLEITEGETNPGVRFTALDLLIEHATEEKDEKLFAVLAKLATQDSNSYVRLKSASALRKVKRDDF